MAIQASVAELEDVFERRQLTSSTGAAHAQN